MNHHSPEEEALGKTYDGRLMRRLLAYLKPYRHLLVVGVMLLVGMSGLQLLGPYLTKLAIDVYIRQGDMAGLSRIAFFYALVLVGELGFRYLQRYITAWMGQQVMNDIRNQVFRKLSGSSLAFFDRNPVGRLVTRVTNDVEALNEMFSSGVVTIFGDVFTLLGIMGVMLAMHAKLALITFTVLPLLFLLAHWFRSRVRSAFRDIRIRLARINAFLQETIIGITVVQLFNRQQRNAAAFEEINRAYREAQLRTIFYYAIFFPAVELISAVAIGLIIWHGGGSVVAGTLTLGALVAFIQYAQRFFRPVTALSEKYNILQGAMAASERIFELLDRQAEIPNPPRPIRLSPVRGEIVFERVWFAYKDEEWVLRDVSFQVEPGQRIALVGATGSGKTSIINLICRFYEANKGRILVDGVDLRKLDKFALRRHIGLVLQDVFIFSGTIKENIRLGDPTISDQIVQQAARYVNADHFIRRLPGAFNHELTERGTTLSVGQKQLLSFARALAHNPSILVLDEATSSVDTETELLIQDALSKLMQGRTSIIIAHRLSTIQYVDTILVLHKGQIKERGTHQQLLQKQGIYYKLYKLQYKDQQRPVGVAEETLKHGGRTLLPGKKG